MFGNITSAVGERRYLVRFDDGTENECSSAVLRVEKTHSSLPPDVPLPSNEIEYHVVEDEVQEEIIDQEEEEPLTGESPDSDEEEEEVESTNNDASDDPPPGMPGQLPTEHEQPMTKDYATVKKVAWDKINSLV